MGLARAAIHLLMNEAVRRPFRGSIVTLGRQHVYMSAQEVTEMARKCGLELRKVPVELHRESVLARQGFVSDDWLFQSMGFDEVVRVDYSNYEVAEVLLDLNDQSTSESLSNRFDVVLDSGTVEHVFDIAAALRHCARMVRRGGRVVHLTPSSNCVEHGFYSVSPTLYADFYSASGFIVDKVWLCESPLEVPRAIWKVYDYLGSAERFISLGQLSDRIWLTFSVATAQANSEPRTPQQWFYTKTWSDSADQSSSIDTPNPAPQFEDGSRSQQLMNLLARAPKLQSTAARAVRRWRRWRYLSSLRSHKIPYPFLGEF